MGTSRSKQTQDIGPGELAERRVLVANRGEIACRILRGIRDEGGIAIAIYSEADRTAPHVGLADEAYCVGAPPVGESYLNQERILEIAKRARVDLLHPGYGFFAENGGFAQAVQDAGITWIGPSPHAIKVMGDKIEARRAVEGSGVAVVPGSGELPPDPEKAVPHAEKIGYPVLLKAAFGGGGKGMRVAENRKELIAAVEMARREAASAFGNATVYLEKWIRRPRHIEIQLLGDQQGNVVHFGERECSIQRRHQKLLEECPTPARFPDLRNRMGSAAVEIAQAIGYQSAGTVEFLLDTDGSFYFLEMNTRLQVEHPVTEMVTGFDLVRRQLRIAIGQPLDVRQEDISWRGAAIECRINAEDAERGFIPSTGRIEGLHLPEGAGVRNDVGFINGTEVSPHYDPMMGKLIVWGEDRNTAIARSLRALHEYRIGGVRTNIPFHAWLLSHPRFIAGEIDTAFLAEEFRPEEMAGGDAETAAVVAAAIAAFRTRPTFKETTSTQTGSAWKFLGRPGAGGKGWR